MKSNVPVIGAVMVHVPDPVEAIAWYREAFPEAECARVQEHDFDYLQVGQIRIEVVRADDKVRAGPAGSVVYWYVEDIELRLRHLLACGATLYRGPMNIEEGQRMCQVRDPWGNCIGLRGR